MKNILSLVTLKEHTLSFSLFVRAVDIPEGVLCIGVGEGQGDWLGLYIGEWRGEAAGEGTGEAVGEE